MILAMRCFRCGADLYGPRFVVASVILPVLVWTGRVDARADGDVERALAQVRSRAAAGDVVAQFSLGSLLYYGEDQLPQAIDWFRKAAAQGYAPAEFQMGQLYDFGFGVTADVEQAFAWYRKAAKGGSAAAQRAVGDFYRRGRGVAADQAEAVAWYRRAADGDDLRAQYQLGQMYFDGTGVTRDYVSAYVWFDIAAGQTPLVDNQKAILELRNIAAARMTPEQVEEATRRASAWHPAGVGRL
jgi:TPR repeat protein